MSDLGRLFYAESEVRRRRAESENASARLQLAEIEERMARLLSQHEPVARLDVDREQLRELLRFVKHGDMSRLNRGLGLNKGGGQ